MEANQYKDHIHMHVRISPKLSVAAFMGYLKGIEEYIKNQIQEDIEYK